MRRVKKEKRKEEEKRGNPLILKIDPSIEV